MSDGIVVVDNGSTYETQESAIVAKNEADRAEQWAKYSEEKANLADERAVDAAESSDAAAQAATAAIEAKQYAETAITDENLIVVATDLKSTPSNIKKTAGSIDNVNTVGNDIENINAVAANKVNIDKVAADKDNIDTVATNILNVNTVAKNIDNVNLLAPHTEAMEALAPDIMDVVTVAGIAEQTKNVSNNMTAVVDVSNNKSNINNVSVNMPFVEGVSENIEHVVAVDRNKTNIDNVASNKTNINNVAENITSVNNVSKNMADVKNAVQSANDARLWAIGTKTEKPEGSAKYWANEARSVAQIMDASETIKGITRFATDAEAKAGLDNTTAITPKKLQDNIANNVGRINQLGFNGVLESGVITFTPDQDTYELKEGYEYEIDLLFSAVGKIDDSTQLKIVNGTDTINIVNVLDSDYSKATTYKAMKQVCRYDTEVGWRWIFNVRYSVASDGSKVFVMPSTATNVDTTDIYNKIDTKQDKSTAVNYNNITNCITEIPQDIKLELNNNNTIVLKKGSIVYVPNGAGNFDKVTITQDVSDGADSIRETMLFFHTSTNRLVTMPVEYCFSGSTAPTSFYGGIYAVWYDTTNNIIKITGNGGASWDTNYSFPVCLAHETTTTYSISQVFNGFGYIGSTIFALPGVKGLIPNGRNADGSLNNIEFTINNVLLRSLNYSTDEYSTISSLGTSLGEALSAQVFIQKEEPLINSSNYERWYNLDDNYWYYHAVNGTSWLLASQENQICIVSRNIRNNGRITSFAPKTVFHALDYNDASTISGWSMPSSRYINLTLGASDSTYVAPANGWFIFDKRSSAAGQFVVISNDTGGYVWEGSSTAYTVSVECNKSVPVKKDDVIKIVYTLGGATECFAFIYAEGDKLIM